MSAFRISKSPDSTVFNFSLPKVEIEKAIVCHWIFLLTAASSDILSPVEMGPPGKEKNYSIQCFNYLGPIFSLFRLEKVNHYLSLPSLAMHQLLHWSGKLFFFSTYCFFPLIPLAYSLPEQKLPSSPHGFKLVFFFIYICSYIHRKKYIKHWSS